MTDTPLAPAVSAADEPAGQRIVLVTGPSGAGRSTAINVLEDLGFEAIDNLPLTLVPLLMEGSPRPAPLALGLDVRNRDFSTANVIELIDTLTRNPAYQPEVIYLDCSTDVLVRRYNETRRRHPLMPHASPREGIEAERDLLAPIRARADVLIDTSELSPHDLKAELTPYFDIAPDRRLTISVQSFSYKRGVPRGVDVMFDCRFLANPHWEARLRPLTGLDPAVRDYVAADPRYPEFFARVRDLILFMLPAQLEEGKTHLAIGFGCTGGKHRSVTLTENMAEALAEAGWQVSKRHRELERREPGLASMPARSDGVASEESGKLS
ncbi:MAG: RNase adapter RapZ [Paracoccus sp. (in: a-proteobacteria)]|uniref:RNase adapter RapZ n=1 Tax=Paracoccus sp. TaxID=267 RepID=UPI0026E0D1B8|nr:RNase adapter RapZ [Paracoccus sp. (in: a-proteobacteria)]MDO5620673.1 RNase adapter RapZ [Paracoccus sp. (in: a-proteobacteria)]